MKIKHHEIDASTIGSIEISDIGETYIITSSSGDSSYVQFLTDQDIESSAELNGSGDLSDDEVSL